MSENNCRNCKYFDGFDGVGELWTDCSLLGGFKDSRTNCEHFEKKVTRYDLLNRINELEKENEQLRKQNQYLSKKLAEPIDLRNLKHKHLVGKPKITKKQLIEELTKYWEGK